MKKIILLLFCEVLSFVGISQDTLTLEINKSKYDSVAINFVYNKYESKFTHNPLKKYKFNELKILSIPVFSISENRKNFDCNSNIVDIIDFNQYYRNQIVVVCNSYKIIQTYILRDSTMSKTDSLWFLNKIRYNKKILSKYIKANNKTFIFGINDDAISGIWAIKDNNIWHIQANIFGIKYYEGTKWCMGNYNLELIKNPLAIIACPSLKIRIKSKLEKLKIKKQCKKTKIAKVFIDLKIK